MMTAGSKTDGKSTQLDSSRQRSSAVGSNHLTEMYPQEQLLLRSVVGDAEPCLCVRSQTYIDTGRWYRRSRLWVCVVGDQLAMLAVARRHYTATITVRDCPDSHYCNATGELVIEPGEKLEYNRFKMSPRQALRILGEMKSDEPRTMNQERQTANPT